VVFVVGVFPVAELAFVAVGTFASFLQLVIVAKEIMLIKKGKIIFFISLQFASKFTNYFSIFHWLRRLNLCNVNFSC